MANDAGSDAMTAAAPALEIRGLSCSFGPTRALDGVDLDVAGGEVVALLGQNGAGKSTLIKLLAGIHRPTAGTIRIGGRAPQRGLQAGRSRAAEVAFVHQDLGLIEPLSVAENIAHVAGFQTRRGLVSWRRQRELAARVLERWEFDVDPAAPVGSLDPVQRALVAIGRALSTDARVVVLDEPTASLPGHDVELLFAAVERMRAGGVAVLYVTHRLAELERLADRIVVLRDGVRVADLSAAEVDEAAIVELIVGRALASSSIDLPAAGAAPVLRLDGASGRSVTDVSLTVAPGEIVALVGLLGAGHRAVGRLVAGAEPLGGGAMRIGGRDHRPRSTRDAIAGGVAYLPADRVREASFQAADSATNFWARAVTGARWRRPAAERRAAGAVLRDWEVVPADPVAPFRALSGGNQQRVLLAKWLAGRPAVLVVDEPTAGVDVGGRAALYERLAQAARGGVATLLVSSDAEEVVELAHRAVVFGGGRAVTELRGAELTVDRITLECGRA
ncbi:MAG TPA: sugar ABC transporter ATP-binding protein [Conexibacter sp.]|nr:sugar ABC transporter ATP-binding protein [Conexibacter sp.]